MPSEEIDSNPALKNILSRRSVVANCLASPGPNDSELQLILQAAARVPDHRKLGPWRFIVFSGNARSDFGDNLSRCFAQANEHATEKQLDFERKRFLRAPLVIAVVSAPVEDKKNTPIWEQQLSCGAACQNILLASAALGYASQWLTEWYSYDTGIAKILNIAKGEQIAGFIYIGTGIEVPTERDRPTFERCVSRWTPE